MDSYHIQEKEKIFHYGDFITNIAMEFVARNMSAENLLHSELTKLKTYDNENDSNYFITLKTFVQSLYNKNETADMLNIHRNTLFYRLEKIYELTGMNIRNIKTANHLLLSFYYLDTVEHKSKGSKKQE